MPSTFDNLESLSTFRAKLNALQELSDASAAQMGCRSIMTARTGGSDKPKDRRNHNEAKRIEDGQLAR